MSATTEETHESLTVSTWPVWELINPSDPYTFRAPNVLVAGMVAAFLSPSYGAKRVDGDERSPMLLGWDEWMDHNAIDDEWIDDHADQIADAYDSFLIGDALHRADTESMLNAIPDPAARLKWKLERQDRHRTSLSAIGEAAYHYVGQFRKIARKRTIDVSVTQKDGE